nr:single-stranded DNA-binding protein [uncultured archaeon]
MRGIEAAFTGTIGRDAQLRTAKSGREWLSFSVAVGDEPDQQWVQVAAFFGHISDLASQLTVGTQVYAEGKIKLRSWEGPDGPHTGLSVIASVIQPLGLIGRKRPKKARSGGTAAASTVRTQSDVNAPLPFDDPIPF